MCSHTQPTPSPVEDHWSSVATNAFEQAKELLDTATLLNHPAPDAPTCIMTDASDVAVGAVLQQFIDGIWKPISYFSCKLNHAESRYSKYDRELLALYLSIRHFCCFNEGHAFHVVTDHKPLTYSLATNFNRYLPRQIRHLSLFLSSQVIFGTSMVVTILLPMLYPASMSPLCNSLPPR